MGLKKRLMLLFLADIVIIWVSIVSSYLFRFDGAIPPGYIDQIVIYGWISSLLCGIFMYRFSLYRRIWEYASIGELASLLKALVIGGALAYVLTLVISGNRVPTTVALLSIETTLLLIGGTRFAWRIWRKRIVRKLSDNTRVLVVGAGDCGAIIARELMQPHSEHELMGFIDDDRAKLGMHVLGIPVVGSRHEIANVITELEIQKIIIAIPSAPRHEISNIINLCISTGVKIKIIPALSDLITGKVTINAIRDISVEDLLGREPVRLDLDGISSYLNDKVVLVTGAGGSIGSELSRQIASFGPKSMLLLGHGENSIYTIEMELRITFPDLQVMPIIADIQDRVRIEEVFRLYRPQAVFHAAAHKHVPLMERNPAEAVKNNVFGTKNVADMAEKFGAERFVLISSDKAVNPSSVMGTTKRIAEMYIQSLNGKRRTKFSAVRFGNVLGSRGSVIPLFKEQIKRGGPVTVTHPDMVRYFMTIPEAVQLVIQAGALSEGGEIYILDMGEPVKIVDLAQDLIRLSGFEPDVDIKIEFSGVREGEKLFEELLSMEEGVSTTQHDRIFVGQAVTINRLELELEFKKLERVIQEDNQRVKEVLSEIVPSNHRNVKFDFANVP